MFEQFIWSKVFESYSKITQNDLKPCISDICKIYEEAADKLTYVHKKYQELKYCMNFDVFFLIVFFF